MFKALTGSLLAACQLFAALAVAQPPSASPQPPSAVDAAKPGPAIDVAKPAPTAVHKDPHGVKGISPFREAVNKGDGALLARDFEGALAAYQDALSKEPQNALGHYRVGEAQVSQGDLHEAERAFADGLRFVTAADPALKAKLLFALADVRERQKSWDEASAQWAEYQTLAGEQKVGFEGSGAERKRSIEAWKKLSVASAEVKSRIQNGIAAADEAVRKSSK